MYLKKYLTVFKELRYYNHVLKNRIELVLLETKHSPE